MRKDRLAQFRKRLIEKHRQLADEVGRTALYGKDQEDDSIKDLGDQANTAYTREFFFELGNGNNRLLRDVVSALQRIDDGSFGNCERCGETIGDKRLEALPFARHCIGCQRLIGLERAPASGENDPQAAEAMRRAEAARAAGRPDEARTLFRYVVQRWPAHVGGLHALRDLAVEARDWDEAIAIQQSLLELAPSRERHAEAEWLAVGYYEMGRLELARGEATAAVGHFRAALRADRDFVPASVALGDAQEAAGDPREAVRTWERAAETHPVLPLLARLERAYREQDRPSRMIALYRAAAERVPDDLALAAALGRVYFELEMLDEAADQFEKIEVRAPDLPTVHAFLGAVFERRGDTREAFDEYRRALRLAHGFDWPHRCTACGVAAPRWQDRCDACRRWNTLRPASAR